MDEFRLETRRLVLRPLGPADAEAFSAYRSDPQVARFQGWEAPFSLERAREFIARLAEPEWATPGEWFQVAILRREDGGLVGDCAFQRLAAEPRQAQIGFTLARRYQGQGYAAEAVMALLGYLFEGLGLHRVTAVCDAENGTSIRLLERLDFRREGDFRENVWFKGIWGSEYLYALLAREWRARQSG
ncbi:MAG TPA: GNAT family protein [Candidatus Aminicenantes bacterium]|nr:GNAT family protein [Candidatus Aminicenantes bacterium]